MSVLWMDDPSFYTVSQLTSRYNSSTTSSLVALPNTTGRFGGSCWECNGSINGFNTNKTVAAAATGTIAISYKFATSINNQQILAFLDSGTVQVDLRLSNTGQILVTRNGTQIGSTSSNAMVPNVWYRIEFKATIDPSAGVIEVRVNGTSTGWIPSTSSLNTRATSNSTFNTIQSGNTAAGGSAHTFANDFIYTDTNSPNANFLGDKRCFLRVPSSDSSVTWTPTFAAFIGTHAYVVGEQLKDSNNNVQRCTIAGTSGGSAPSWATTGGNTTVSGGATFVVVGSGANPGAHNWMAVSENPADDDSSYNADSTPGDIDAFGFPTLPAGAQNISAVDNILRARKDDAGTRSIATYINSGGTVALGATIALSTSYAYVDTINETDPNTSAAWTVSNLNAATLGYKEIA